MKFRTSLHAILSIAFLLITVEDSIAIPDFDVHPRTIEVLLTWAGVNVDLEVENDGDENLLWEITIDEDAEDWILFRENSPRSGAIQPGESVDVLIKLTSRDIDEDHVYTNLLFESNDPTREEYEVPVAGHTVGYPRIVAGWTEGWGAWWGIDLNLVFDEINWGQIYDTTFVIANLGGADLEVADINSNNGYFEIEPTEFGLEGWTNRLVHVIFNAEEVDYNVATITSESNAWDPRELNFRIIANVSPVFRRMVAIPDFVREEDAVELLVSDLDTIFVSSDNSVEFEVVQSNGLNNRITRGGELFIQPVENWNGISEVIVNATLEDSVIADTFIVEVIPIPDPPDYFDLIAPEDGIEIHIFDTDTAFVWQIAEDPDEDTVHYEITIVLVDDGESLTWTDIENNWISTEILLELVEIDESTKSFTWTVNATDGDFTVDAWSTFTNSVTPSSVKITEELLPDRYGIIGIYPNPFNGYTTILLNTHIKESIVLTLHNLSGRRMSNIYSGVLSAGINRLSWRPQGIPSGQYLLRFKSDENYHTFPVIYSK